MTTLRKHLDHPAVIAEYVTAYNEERKRLRRQAGNDLARLTRREGEIGRELARLIDSIAKGVPAEAVAGRIRELDDERTGVALAINQSQEAENIVALHPSAINRYKRDVTDLADALKAGDSDDNAGIYARVRDLVSAIVVHAKPNEPGIKIDIKGRLAVLCGADIFPNCAGNTPRKVSGGSMVAREGLEPPTPGL